MESKSFSLNKADLISIGKSMALATIGFAISYVVGTILPSLDLGKNAWIIPFVTVALNAAQKWISAH